MESVKTRRVEQQLNIVREVGCNIDQHASILDLGCGNGDTVQAYRNLSYEAFGVDLNFKEGSNVASLEKEGYIRLTDPANYRLPFSDDTFDLVVSDMVFEHINDYSGALSEIRRVLKKDGVCLNFFPSRYTFIEQHVYVPLATVIQQYWWLRLWAGLGIRKPEQRGLRAAEVARWNHNYLTQHTNYLSKRKIKEHVLAYFSNIQFAEDAFLKHSMRGGRVYRLLKSLPFVSNMYGTLLQRVLLFW